MAGRVSGCASNDGQHDERSECRARQGRKINGFLAELPLGYDVKDRKLVVNGPEASTVRLIFRRYAELGSVALLKAQLDRLGIVSKRRDGGADGWPAANISPAEHYI
jgi:hypothetical protein